MDFGTTKSEKWIIPPDPKCKFPNCTHHFWICVGGGGTFWKMDKLICFQNTIQIKWAKDTFCVGD
jgi:hypothetical protein